MNLFKLVPVLWRWVALLALLGTFGGWCWTLGANHEQAKSAADKNSRDQVVIAQQQDVIRELKGQKERGDRAEALGAKLKNDYDHLSNDLADSMRAYQAAKRSSAMCGSMGTAAGNDGGLSDRREAAEDEELVRLTQEANDSCLASYKQLQMIRAAAPHK